MAWLGARPYKCVDGHWFAIGQTVVNQPRACPMCASESLIYMGDSAIPIFVLEVEDVWRIGASGYEDETPFKQLSVEDCLEVGMDLETPWDALEALAEMALQSSSA